MKKILILAALALASVGCKDSTSAQYGALGSKHKITLYGCDGNAVREWESTGSVSNQAQSDGWYFEDAKTGKLVEVAGNITIEQE